MVSTRSMHTTNLSNLKDLYYIGDKLYNTLVSNNIHSLTELMESEYYTTLPEKSKEIIHFNLQNELFSTIQPTSLFADYIIFDTEFLSDGKNQRGRIFSIVAKDNHGQVFKQSISSVTDEAEREMLSNFLHFVDNRVCIHWGMADNIECKKAFKRLSINAPINTFDLCNYCMTNNVYFRGAFNYKLKSIENAFIKEGLLQVGSHCTYQGHVLASIFRDWMKTPYKFDYYEMNKILNYNVNDVLITESIYNFIVSGK